MNQRIGATLRRMWTTSPPREPVHFHLGHDGRPFVCDFAHCDSPAVSLDEVSGPSPTRRHG
jgi:hypothetical protein